MAEMLSLQGMDNLIKNLAELGNRVERVENQALRAGGEVFRQAAQGRAPRSSEPRQPKPETQAWRTGEHMADNIVVTRVNQDEAGKYIEVGPTPGDNSPFFYAKFQEFGTSKMPANPFMGPAAAEKKDEAVAATAAVFKGALGL